MALADDWRAAVEVELPAAIELRHELHQHPEVSGEETATARRVAEAIGRGDGRVVARTGRLIRVAGPFDGEAVALRTELDALPVQESTDVAWASVNGAMHACGHDVHMAALVAVARAAGQIELPVPLLALLQPREEVPDSGARDVVSADGLRGVGTVVAAHVQPQLANGVLAAVPGAVNAGIDEFTVTVQGTGGHSGYPHRVNDPVLALSAIVVALQQLGARLIDPVFGVACMVTRLAAGSAANVVPPSATGSGTLRTMRASDRDRGLAALSTIATNTAAGYGCTATVSTEWSEPPLVNDQRLATRAAGLLSAMGYPVDTEWRSFGSDDFAHYCETIRGLMIFVGTGDEQGGLHHPSYLPPDGMVATVADALVAGCCAAL